MAIALVATGAITQTSSASVTPAFAQATTAGNLLIARVITNSGAIGTTASGWTLTNFGGILPTLAYKPNCSSGETAPTFTSTGSTFMAADLLEFAGADTASPLDQVASGSATACSTFVADSDPSDVAIFLGWVTVSKSATLSVTDTWSPAGGTKVASHNTGASKQTTHMVASAYLLNTNGGAGLDSIACTITPSTGTASAQSAGIATFKPAAQATPRPVVLVASFAAISRASNW